MKARLAIFAVALCGLAGCGAPSNTCTGAIQALDVSPAIATVSSSAAPPGDQTKFSAGIAYVPNPPGANCAIPQIVMSAFPAWTNPDPIHITISSAQDQTNGTAICKGPTGGPVRLTATATSSTQQPLTATVQLTCE